MGGARHKERRARDHYGRRDDEAGIPAPGSAPTPAPAATAPRVALNGPAAAPTTVPALVASGTVPAPIASAATPAVRPSRNRGGQR